MTLHRWTLTCALVVAVGLGGCRDDTPPTEVGTGATPTTTTTTVPSSPTTSVPATTVPAGPRNPHRWEGYTVGPDGATLTFSYYAGVEPCSAFDSIVADEGPDSVRVTVYERPGPEGAVCIMIAELKTASVTLAAPLGARTVVDGAA